MSSQKIHSQSFNFYELYNSQKLLASKLIIDEPQITVAENLKREKRKNRTPSMPNELLQELPFYMNIEELEIHNANIVYNERAKTGSGTGTIYFTETDALIANITNDSTLMSVSTPVVIKAHTQFMDEGTLSLVMTLPLLEKDFSCTYKGSLGEMKAETINEMIVPNTNMSLKKGEIQHISFNAKVAKGVAKGEMLAKYSSFKVQVYRKNQTKKTHFKTFFSNLLISKSNKKKKI